MSDKDTRNYFWNELGEKAKRDARLEYLIKLFKQLPVDAQDQTLAHMTELAAKGSAAPEETPC